MGGTKTDACAEDNADGYGCLGCCSCISEHFRSKLGNKVDSIGTGNRVDSDNCSADLLSLKSPKEISITAGVGIIVFDANAMNH